MGIEKITLGFRCDSRPCAGTNGGWPSYEEEVQSAYLNDHKQFNPPALPDGWVIGFDKQYLCRACMDAWRRRT